MSFHCPHCDAKTAVTDTRAELRRRRCLACGYRFMTQEVEYDGRFGWEQREYHKCRPSQAHPSPKSPSTSSYPMSNTSAAPTATATPRR